MLLETIISVLVNQWYLLADFTLLTCVGLLLTLRQLRKNYLEICLVHTCLQHRTKEKNKEKEEAKQKGKSISKGHQI